MSRLKCYRESEDGNYLVTLAIGKSYLERWERISLPLWEMYAERNKIGLVAMIKEYPDRGRKRVDWQKLLVGKALIDEDYRPDRICFIDYDMIPNPYTENIFNQTKKNILGMVSQRNNIPTNNIDTLLRKIAFFRKTYVDSSYPLDSYLTAKPERVFRDHGFEELKDYMCGGFFIFNCNKHASYLAETFEKYTKDEILIANEGEEVHLNFACQKHKDFETLDYKWHKFWHYEMAEKYSHLYKRERRNKLEVVPTIINSIIEGGFMHFVGSWEKWAWKFAQDVQKSENLETLEMFNNYREKVLESKSRGQLYPQVNEELDIISK